MGIVGSGMRMLRRIRRRLTGSPSGHRRERPADAWSIGIYGGEELAGLGPLPGTLNPVLTARDVTDAPAAFVADPFMLRRQDGWFMFFEVFRRDTWLGEIGLAVSADARRWSYEGIVLSEPFHLSYPLVLTRGDEVWMVPETDGAGALRLYRARRFPYDWELAGAPLEGRFLDPSLFHWHGRWWMLAETNPEERKWDTLRLYHAGDPSGPWQEHPSSPIVDGIRHSARPAGRVVIRNGRPVRFAQVCEPDYGTAVRAFEILELDETTYRETELPGSPILGPGQEEWNRTGMHHLDAVPLPGGGWLACVDGCGRRAWPAQAPTARGDPASSSGMGVDGSTVEGGNTEPMPRHTPGGAS
jgi:hypothetical protein